MAYCASTRKGLICLQKSDLCIYAVSNPGYTQPDPDHQLLLQQLKLNLPAQPPPRICV